MKYFLLMLCSCASLPYRTIGDTTLKQCSVPALVFTHEVPKELQKTIQDSFNYWNHVTKLNLFLYDGETEISPYSGEAGALIVVAMKDLEATTKGRYALTARELLVSMVSKCIVGAKIYINSHNAFAPEMETALRKEAGFALGLNTSPDFTSLMSGHIDTTLQQPVDADEETIAAIRTLYSH